MSPHSTGCWGGGEIYGKSFRFRKILKLQATTDFPARSSPSFSVLSYAPFCSFRLILLDPSCWTKGRSSSSSANPGMATLLWSHSYGHTPMATWYNSYGPIIHGNSHMATPLGFPLQPVLACILPCSPLTLRCSRPLPCTSVGQEAFGMVRGTIPRVFTAE
jgi:hypothetical protein